MSVLMSLFLGIVQGIAEFLPISSSGHLAILQNLFREDYTEGHLLFDVLVHLGTLIAIFAVYRSEIKAMIKDGLEYLRMRSDADYDDPITLKAPARALLFVLIGTIPMFVAVFFMSSVNRLFHSLGFIGFALLVTGGLLFVSDKYITRGNKTEKTMTAADAIIIGLAQMIAILPGLSRSGTTIVVGLSRGLSGSFAVRFSLLLSIPAVLGATVITLFQAIREGADLSQIPVYLPGFIMSAVVGFFAIQIIRRLISKGGFGKFAYYCWGVGVLTLILSLFL